MSTHSSARNLITHLDNPELTIRRRSRTDPTLWNDFEMAAEGNGDLPVPDLRTMEGLCRPSLNGRGGPIYSIAIQATNFGLKNDMSQQVHNSCQFHGLPSDDDNMHLDKFLHVNQQVKAVTPNWETCGGPHSFNDCPATVGHTQNVYAVGAYQGASQGQNYPPAYQASVYQALVHQAQIPQPQVVTTNEFTNFMKANDAILKNMQTNMTSLTNSNLELKNMFSQFMKMNTASSSGSGTLPGNTITNPKEELKGITTRSGTAYQGPTIPTTYFSFPPAESLILNSEPIVAPIIEPVAAPVSAPKPNQKLLIPYPSRLHDQKLRDKANDQRDKFFQIFKDLNFNISFADALILMPKFGTSIKRELTLRVGKEAITFNLDQTSRYSANYNDMTANRIDVIDMVCEEYSQKVLGFSDVITSGNPTPYYDLIVSTTSLTLTPFGESDFILEVVDAFLSLKDDPTLPEVDQSYVDTEGDILLLESFLNDDPSLPPPNQGNSLPQI
nr:reverse transcriptase domain-containing protein [Tanacetum cinerariifolium]